MKKIIILLFLLTAINVSYPQTVSKPEISPKPESPKEDVSKKKREFPL
jgi:hypothetical protein